MGLALQEGVFAVPHKWIATTNADRGHAFDVCSPGTLPHGLGISLFVQWLPEFHRKPFFLAGACLLLVVFLLVQLRLVAPRRASLALFVFRLALCANGSSSRRGHDQPTLWV